MVDADVVPHGRFLVYQPPVPALAVDRNGDPVVAWADRRTGDTDVLLRRSTSEGFEFGPPVRVNGGPGAGGVSTAAAPG